MQSARTITLIYVYLGYANSVPASGKLYIPNSQHRVLILMWVAVTSYVDFLVLIEYRWEQNDTIQNLKEFELR